MRILPETFRSAFSAPLVRLTYGARVFAQTALFYETLTPRSFNKKELKI
jgi:hypothetical protein